MLFNYSDLFLFSDQFKEYSIESISIKLSYFGNIAINTVENNYVL